MSQNYYRIGVCNNGSRNTVIGVNAAPGGSSAVYDDCVIVGTNAGQMLTNGDCNTAVGSGALQYCDGSNNVALGFEAAKCAQNSTSASTASNNVVIGYKAGQNLQTDNNVFIGTQTGQVCTTGTANTIIGHKSVTLNTISDYNTVVGGFNELAAGVTGSAVLGALNTINHSNCIVLGRGTTTAAANTLYIGSSASSLTTSTTATAGSNGSVPAQVTGYLNVYINGSPFKIPYYT